MYVHQYEDIVSFSRINQIHLLKTEIENSENILIEEYILNKGSIHVFLNSSNIFMRCILTQTISCFPSISVALLVT